MKGNQRLEALAALCGGQSDAPVEQNTANSSLTAKPAEAHAGNNTQQSQSSVDSMIQQRQNPLATQQSPIQNVTQQQWQQAIAAAAALQGGGVNPALAAQSFLLSSGLSQPQPQSIGENAYSTMQQLALHQYTGSGQTISSASGAIANYGGWRCCLRGPRTASVDDGIGVGESATVTAAGTRWTTAT